MRDLTQQDVENPTRLMYVLRELRNLLITNKNDLEKAQYHIDNRFKELNNKIPPPTVIDGLSSPEALARLGVDELAMKKSNLTATIAPGTGDDELAGYGIGSEWFVQAATPEIWRCVDPTRGNAVWIQVY